MTPPAEPENTRGANVEPPAHDRQSDKAGTGDADEAADYIAGATADLAVMARLHGLKTLGFLLDMVQLEAEEHARLKLLRSLK